MIRQTVFFAVTLLALALALGATRAQASPAETQLTPAEQKALRQRILDFYANPNDPAQMSRYLPKIEVRSGKAVHPHPFAHVATNGWAAPKNRLQQMAGIKAGSEYRQHREHFLSKHFKKKKPKQWASIEDDDLAAELADGWTDITRDLSQLPNSGQSSVHLWSDDYWKTQYGGTSLRYAGKKKFKNYKEAIADYAQPEAFTKLLAEVTPDKLAAAILNWSPAEKYDLTVGDTDFGLTTEQKEEGSYSLKPDGDVEDWMGICDGWAAASVMAPKPAKPASSVGPDGLVVHWYPNDLRAILSQSWARSSYDGNNAGGRCYSKEPKTYPNGRVMEQQCFDTNPATLTLALGNMIGRAKGSFIIDSSFDYEVWNQPIKSYELTYFNPLKPDEQSADWTKVAVDYDDAFKKTDRFQHPLTRGVRTNRGYDDSDVQKIVGVVATVVYLDELIPAPGDAPLADPETRVTYTYDLELHDVHGKLVPKGGEWHDNTHPDFLWIPRPEAIAVSGQDGAGFAFDAGSAPSDALTRAASTSSGDGMPLCRVVKGLLNQSVESDETRQYSCGE